MSWLEALSESKPVPQASGKNRAPVPVGQAQHDRPGDDFSARTDWADILLPLGAVLHHEADGERYWTRPGKDPRAGYSATTGWADDADRLKLFTSNWAPFADGEVYTKFGAFTLLNHGGDYKAAAWALAEQGYGRPADRPDRGAKDAGSGYEVPHPADLVDAAESAPAGSPDEEVPWPGNPAPAESGRFGREYDAEGHLVYDPEDPLAPIKEAVKDAPAEQLAGRVAGAVEAMARFGMDTQTKVSARVYVKSQKLLNVSQFDEILDEAKRARTRRHTSSPSIPSADDAHLHTPPSWASEQDILARVVRTLRVCTGLVGENRNAKLVYLAITSRLLDKQVSIVVKGLSSSGKSYTIECAAVLFPPEAVYTMTAMSERALIYLDESMEHRTIILYEATALREGREKAEDNQTAYIVRSLLSEGHIEYPVVLRQEDGTLRTEKIIVPGPTNLVTSTTSISLHPENETRMLSLSSNDSQAQTRAVMVMSSEDDNPGRKPDVSDWHAYQRWLASANHEVAIPYARCVAAQIPPVAVRLRRDWNAVRALIRTHAMMHQLKRDTDEHGRIVATLDDYSAIRSLVADLVAEGIGATVPKTVRQTVETVRKLAEDGTCRAGVTVAAVVDALKIERSAATRRLHTARDRGFLMNLEDKRGKPARYDLGDPMPGETAVLPPRGQICTGPCEHLQPGETAGQDCDCTGVCRCATSAEGKGGGTYDSAAEATASSNVAPLPSAKRAHLHTPARFCVICGNTLDPKLAAAGDIAHPNCAEDPAA
jgi:hypothetical protein